MAVGKKVMISEKRSILMVMEVKKMRKGRGMKEVEEKGGKEE